MKKSSLNPYAPSAGTRIIRPMTEEDLRYPASLLAAGELVAFPTETVYGLGADATNPSAVAGIFRAKGRPSDNPLIVHVARREDIDPLVREITPLAECLIKAFMPGPITLVMKKSARIPDQVSAGLPTVGIRMPSHPVARNLIRLAGVGIAAPSANLSGSPSPTTAEHVERDLSGRIPCIVDGGPSEVGIESTVVDVTGTVPVILRPGAVTKEMIERACREDGLLRSNESANFTPHAADDETPRAPGMKYRHYAPKAKLLVIYPDASGWLAGFLTAAKDFYSSDKGNIGIYCGREDCDQIKSNLPTWDVSRTVFFVYGENRDIEGAAHSLFAGIRELDSSGVSMILAAGFAGDGLARAYMNRLEKAAGEKKELEPIADDDEPKEIRVLFVCTGNTCRSPMAEVIFRKIVADNGPYRLTEDPQKRAVITVSSAGIFAEEGGTATQYAISAVRALFGADLSLHRSRRAVSRLLSEQRIIFCMTREHAAILRRFFPEYGGRIHSFGEFAERRSIDTGIEHSESYDVPDPFGQTYLVYEKTARRIYDLLDVLWPAILADLGVGNEAAE